MGTNAAASNRTWNPSSWAAWIHRVPHNVLEHGARVIHDERFGAKVRARIIVVSMLAAIQIRILIHSQFVEPGVVGGDGIVMPEHNVYLT